MYVGRWGFPGGHVELGESVVEAALRELEEETGVVADAVGPLTTVDEIGRSADGGILWHYVLVAVLADWRAGDGVAGDDAADVRWVTLDDITRQTVPVLDQVERVARLALAAPRPAP
jgi:ADP-ribose pyrophosphatase YjhB (NUDIX family)